jgi:polysaccharide export outer membrane protein
VGNILLEEGDVLSIPAAGERMVYVFGEVRQQGAYPIPPEGMDILGAIAKAGGFREEAMTRRFFLVRPQGGTAPEVYQLDFGRILEAPAVELADGDRLFLPPTALSRWNKFWRQVLPVGIYSVSLRQSDVL